MNLSAHHRDNHMKDGEINVGDIVWFQAYRRNYPIQGKVVKKGSQIELGCGWVEDERIFYALESIRDDRRPIIFTRTTARALHKEKPPQLSLYNVFDDETGKVLCIMAWDLKHAEEISETLDYNNYRDSEIIDIIKEE